MAACRMRWSAATRRHTSRQSRRWTGAVRSLISIGTTWHAGQRPCRAAPDFDHREKPRTPGSATRPGPRGRSSEQRTTQACPLAQSGDALRLAPCRYVRSAAWRLCLGGWRPRNAEHLCGQHRLRRTRRQGQVRFCSGGAAQRPRHHRVLVRLPRGQVNRVDRTGLAQSVNATDALLDPQWAPRPLERDHQPGRSLKIQALARDIRREQDTGPPFDERGDPGAPFLDVHRSVEAHQGRQRLQQGSARVQRVTKLAEDDQGLADGSHEPLQTCALGPARSCCLRQAHQLPHAFAFGCGVGEAGQRQPRLAGLLVDLLPGQEGRRGGWRCPGARQALEPPHQGPLDRHGRRRGAPCEHACQQLHPAHCAAWRSAELAHVGQHRGMQPLLLDRGPDPQDVGAAARPRSERRRATAGTRASDRRSAIPPRPAPAAPDTPRRLRCAASPTPPPPTAPGVRAGSPRHAGPCPGWRDGPRRR